MLKAAVIMGSDSDLAVMKPCFTRLGGFDIEYTGHVISAHRTPERAAEFARAARGEGYGVIIAAAGKAAHLAGVIAAFTTLPVIAVPVKGSAFAGLDALLSMVQMPEGVPVATVAVDGAANAAILAAEILSLTDEGLAERLTAYKRSLAESVEAKDAALREALRGI